MISTTPMLTGRSWLPPENCIASSRFIPCWYEVSPHRSGAVPGSARLGPCLRSNGLGSGAAGLAGVRNALGLKTKIIAVVSSEVPSYARSMVAGHIVDAYPTDSYRRRYRRYAAPPRRLRLGP